MTDEEVEASIMGTFKKGSTTAKPKSKPAQKMEGTVGEALLREVNERKAKMETTEWEAPGKG